ncbi:TRAP transporter small permease [Rossellomorea vietnamensis]|uniref:TRAP transporter small permease n=1 Tax=Rossellomorea vietnamensis TaxID=218284 RepID=A0A5D4M305_9BACI|nr:TRAP transporter small permease [Rossellomorea vietnamensis]TYR96259.1 TRAP transporter small permease [Rossellomorea vietnamensis]
MKGTNILTRTLEAATILSFLGVIVVVLIQILSRYLPYTAVWTEELTRFLFIYSISFGAPLALKNKEFISVDILTGYLPEKIKEAYEAFIYLVIVVLSFVIAFHGYTFISVGRGQTSATMALDMSIIHASITISFIFIAIYSVVHVINAYKVSGERSER